MSARAAVAWSEPPFELPRATAADLASLRRRLGLPGAREAVAVDFLEDDLREAEVALGAVAGWLGAVEEALRDPRVGRRELAILSSSAGPAARIEHFCAVAESIHRRLAQLAAAVPQS